MWKRIFIAVCFIISITPINAQAFDLRGVWNLTINNGAGSDDYYSTWMVEVNGNEISGTSKWGCCPGFRVDKISGRILNHNEVLITRFIVGQGHSSGTQEYRGVIENGKISGTWSGLGGSGTWKATVSR